MPISVRLGGCSLWCFWNIVWQWDLRLAGDHFEVLFTNKKVYGVSNSFAFRALP